MRAAVLLSFVGCRRSWPGGAEGQRVGLLLPGVGCRAWFGGDEGRGRSSMRRLGGCRLPEFGSAAPGPGQVRAAFGAVAVVTDDLELVRCGGERAMKMMQPLFEGPRRHARSALAARHPLVVTDGRPREDRECARALPPLCDRG